MVFDFFYRLLRISMPARCGTYLPEAAVGVDGNERLYGRPECEMMWAGMICSGRLSPRRGM
jgi:hypothetical protein